MQNQLDDIKSNQKLLNKDNIKKDKKIEQLNYAAKEFYDILEDRNIIANDYKNANKSLYEKNKK